MNSLKINGRSLFKLSKKTMAAKKGKKEKLDPNLRDYDIIWLGGLNAANQIKYFQHNHFHGKMAGFCSNLKFFNEHLYEYAVNTNMKAYKYLAMPFSSNFEVSDARCGKERITEIHPEKNEIVTEKGDIFKYKALVLNTGLEQKANNVPYLKDLITEEFAKTRVFVQEAGNAFQFNRNYRIFPNHKDGDFLLYLPKFPSRREAYDHWYLQLDAYLSRAQFFESHNRSMRIRVITPNDCLFKFPFANELIQEEISNRSMIDVHFGMELTNVEVTPTYNGYKRVATFKDLKTGSEVQMNFGTLLTTPENKKREIYKNNDLADEDGLVKVNPYTLQHEKYQNVFAFGDCANLPTTRNLWATLNQGTVLRNNLWDYMHGNEFKAVYDGYSSFTIHHAMDRVWVFKHRYDYKPTTFNFYIPRFMGWFAYKLKNSLERNYLQKIYQKKMNFGYPYLSKNKYFRPLAENKFLKDNKIPLSAVIIHDNKTPVLSSHHGHDHPVVASNAATVATAHH